jgi:hypothetical protein
MRSDGAARFAATTRLIFDEHQRIADWCEGHIEHFSGWGNEPRAIGLEVNGELRAGVVYTNFSPGNVIASIVVDGGMNRRFLYSIFYNPFIAWKVRHITCTMEASNSRSIKLCSSMGFVERGRLPEAAANGEDIVIMGLLKRDCRFLAWGPK